MNFSFTGRHVKIGESLTKSAKESIEKLAQKYKMVLIDVVITMRKESWLYVTDISLKSDSGAVCFVSSDADDPRRSFELTFRRLEQQFVKKMKDAQVPNAKKTDFEDFDYNDFSDCTCFVPTSGEKAEDNENAPMIIAEVLDDIPLMSVSEASQKLNKDRPAFIFENIANSAVNVVYLRNDGNIGWLDYKIKR